MSGVRAPTLAGHSAVDGVLREEGPAALGRDGDGVGVLTAREHHLGRGVGHQQELRHVERVRQNELARVSTEVHDREEQVLLEHVDELAVVEVAQVFRVDQDVVDQEVENLEPHFDQLPVLVLAAAEEARLQRREVRRLVVAQAQLLLEEDRDQVGDAVEDEARQEHRRRPRDLAAVVVHVVQEELEQLAHQEVLALVALVGHTRSR